MYITKQKKPMSELVIVIIGAVVIVGGVILYAVISTATGLEEDENQNYIPDWIERKFPKIFKGSKTNSLSNIIIFLIY